MTSPKASGGRQLQKRQLVQTTAAKLRDLILTRKPETQIGSLGEVARLLDVGIVTVQQAARILEYEGLLAVRRGPGGGYYGIRPDGAALERSVAAYLRVHGSSYLESAEIMSLLECEMVAAAARCRDEALHAALAALSGWIDRCETEGERIAFEEEFYNLLFKMNARPLFELLARVAKQLVKIQPQEPLFTANDGVAQWKAGRRRTLEAILQKDEELARFEAERHRRELLSRIRNTRREA